MTNQTKWSIDKAHSEVSFKVRHLMISHVRGKFKNFDATIFTNAKDFTTAEIDFCIEVDSISTGDAKRDEHLKSVDFFDVANHKQINFEAKTIGKEDASGLREMWGNLTMKGISKHIKLLVTFGGIVMDPYGNEKAGFTIIGRINRLDWDLNWNTTLEIAGVMVSEDVEIECEIELQNLGEKMMNVEVEPEYEVIINQTL